MPVPHIILKGCFQDGGQFYAEDPPGTDDLPEWERPTSLIADYGDLKDSDMDGARRARERFAAEYPRFVSCAVEV